MKVLSTFGTRPEAIKMAPVLAELSRFAGAVESRVCVTAQHREMLDQVLDVFGIVPDVDLDVMKDDQAPWQVVASVLAGLDRVLAAEAPDLVLVHGDTTTTMAASLAAFYRKIPVGHVEAGLRTHDMRYPFPEEMNRVVADDLASFHFAPTARRAGEPPARRGRGGLDLRHRQHGHRRAAGRGGAVRGGRRHLGAPGRRRRPRAGDSSSSPLTAVRTSASRSRTSAARSATSRTRFPTSSSSTRCT